MKEITYKTHQKILGSVIIAYSALNIFGAVSVLAAFNFIYAFLHEPELEHFVAIMSRLIGISLLVISVPAIIGGVGLLREKEWAKTVTMVAGILYLVFIPVGTVIGIYAIWLNSQHVIREKDPVYATDLVKNAHHG